MARSKPSAIKMANNRKLALIKFTMSLKEIGVFCVLAAVVFISTLSNILGEGDYLSRNSNHP